MTGLVGFEQSGAQDAQSWGSQGRRGSPSCGAGKAEWVPWGSWGLEVARVMLMGPEPGYNSSSQLLSMACHTAAPTAALHPPRLARRQGLCVCSSGSSFLVIKVEVLGAQAGVPSQAEAMLIKLKRLWWKRGPCHAPAGAWGRAAPARVHGEGRRDPKA